MKKLLAMVLALVMTLSLAVSANAFKDDKSISDDYAEAVAVLNGMGVFKGYEDGSFKPTGDITRAEVSAIVYRVYTQDVKDAKASMYATYNKFSDMAGAGWAQGYIGYCANAELVKGYPDGTFKPSGKVTGYEVLAMILRAVGYDKNGEFSGADWALHVAQTAQQAGVLKNVKGIDLNAAASRELVAELLFRAIADASTVNYTPAFGYVTDKVLKLDESTLGYKNFKLEGKADADSFGRPATKWTYNVGDKKTLVVDKPVVSYTTKVAECDIAKDLGISSAKDLEGAYIDGNSYAKNLTSSEVTSNRYATINPLATKSFVGAQGRLTEVYDMGAAGYRLVEINTYLAHVDKVTATTTDRSGHTTDATVDLTVYNGETKGQNPATWDFDGVKATGFVKNDYVLVTISNTKGYSATASLNKAVVESVKAATIVTGGKLTSWTNGYDAVAATHVIGTTTYNDADKFALDYRVIGNWAVITDDYGNVIGLVDVATNYLAVERIEWVRNSGSFGGRAIADFVLADGTKVSEVTVASLDDEAITNKGDAAGNLKLSTVSDYFWNNTAYYEHIMAYSVNEDGSYNLATIAHDTTAANDMIDLGEKAASYTKENATISNKVNQVVATSKTVFLYENTDGYTYTVYTGKENAPSVKDATMCVKYDEFGYAEFVLVRDYKDANNSFYAYVTENASVGGDKNLGTAYNVYKLGETTATIVYDDQPADAKDNIGNWSYSNEHGTGIYKFEVNGKGQIVSMSIDPILCDTHCNNSWIDTKAELVRLQASEPSSNSLIAKRYGANPDNLTNGMDFNLDVAGEGTTKVIKVVKYTNPITHEVTTTLVSGTVSDIAKDSIIIVKYDGTKHTLNRYDAEIIYVMVDGGEDTNPDATNWYRYNVGASYVEANNKTQEVYVSDANMTVADLTNAGLTTTGHYYTTNADGVRSEVAVANNSTATILSIMAQDGAKLTAVNGFNVSYTIVTSK